MRKNCKQTVNVFGYPLGPCDKYESHWFHIVVDSYLCDIGDKRSCRHHEYSEDEFVSWVQKVRLDANVLPEIK